MLADGALPQRGFVRQEQVALDDFLGNRFGAAFAPDRTDRADRSARATAA